MNVEKNAIKEALHERQFNSSLEHSKFIVFNIEYGGFGAMVARRKLALQFGHYFNRTVLFNFTNYVYDDPFKPICNLTLDDLKGENFARFSYEENQGDKVVFFDFNDYWNNTKIKEAYHEKTVMGLSFIEFSGILLNFLELKNDYSEETEKALGMIRGELPIIGVHIRRGDKEVESPYIPINRYLAELYKVYHKTGIKKVFVCSDSEEAIKELIDSDSDSDFEFVYDKSELRHNDKTNNINHALSNGNSKAVETRICIKNIYQLSECSYIIGQSNVQFPKIAICKFSDKMNNLNSYSLINPFNLKNVIWDA